jgi:hypothetical protein
MAVKKTTIEECSKFASDALSSYPKDYDPRNGMAILPYELAQTAATRAVYAALKKEREETGDADGDGHSDFDSFQGIFNAAVDIAKRR